MDALISRIYSSLCNTDLSRREREVWVTVLLYYSKSGGTGNLFIEERVYVRVYKLVSWYSLRITISLRRICSIL